MSLRSQSPFANVQMPKPVSLTKSAFEVDDLKRTDSQILREIGARNDIFNTTSLVSAFNNTPSESPDREPLRRWLTTYVELFAKQSDAFTEAEIEAYSQLAHIKCLSKEDLHLVHVFFENLCKRIHNPLYLSTVMTAIDHALYNIDSNVFQESSVTKLQDLANDLLSKISPRVASYTRYAYKTHRATLLALYQTLMKLHEISEASMTKNIYERFVKTLKEIEKSEAYFPYFFYARLIKMIVKGLVAGHFMAPWMRAGRFLFHFCCGGMYMAHCIREIVLFNFDLPALEACCKHMIQGVSELGDGKWFLELSKICEATRKAYVTKDFSHFRESFGASKRKSLALGVDKKSAKIGKYGWMIQLRFLAMHGSSPQLCSDAKDEIFRLGKWTDQELWIRDGDVFESFVETLFSLKMNGETDPRLFKTLKELDKIPDGHLKARVEFWKEGSEGMLSVGGVEKDVLFEKTKQAMGIQMTFQTIQSMFEELKNHYRNERFSKVEALFEINVLKSIGEFEYDVVCYEKEATTFLPKDNHLKNDFERKRRSRKNVGFEDFFVSRLVGTDTAKEVNKLLLFGNPGTGKTSLSRTYAFNWAEGKHGTEFSVVYVLPIRELNERSLDNSGQRKRITLDTAIANLCFEERRSENGYEALRKLISDQLKQKTTMLILDGFDEGDDVGRRLVHDALEMNCKVLLTSRPYNLGLVRERIDFEMECLGLNDDQLKRFLCRELPEPNHEELLDYLQKKPMMFTLAHVPVVATILCHLWRNRGKRSHEDAIGTSEGGLYARMNRLIWNRYKQRPGFPVNANREETFEALEKIAFEAQKSGRIVFGEDLIDKYAPTETVKQTLKDSGFLLLKMEGNQYQFPHLSFQECFAGNHLARWLLIPASSEMSRTTSCLQKEALKFVSENKYKQVHQLTFFFMTQKLGTEEEDVDTLLEIFEVFDRDPIDFVGLQHIFLKLRILEAFLSVTQLETEDLLSEKPVRELLVNVVACTVMWENSEEHVQSTLEALKKLPNVLQNFPQLISPLMITLESFSKRDSTAKRSKFAVHAMRNALRTFLEEESEYDTLDDEQQSHALEGRTGLNLFREFIGSTGRTHFKIDVIYKQLSFVAEALIYVPKPSKRNLTFLMNFATSHDFYIRGIAIQGLTDYAKKFPSECEPIVDVFLERSEGERNPHVRAALVKSLFEIMKSSRGPFEDILKAFQERCSNDEDAGVRKQVVKCLVEIGKIWLERSENVIPTLQKHCFDEDRGVLSAAAEGLFEIMQNDGRDDEIVMAFLRECREDVDLDGKIVIGLLCEIAKKFPTKAEAVFDVLLEECIDGDCNVPVNASKDLSTIFKILQNRADPIVEILLERCHEEYVVCKKAVICLVELGKLFQTHSERIIKTLLDRHHYENSNIRNAIVEGLSEIARASENEAVKVFRALHERCRDNNRGVRVEAVDCLFEMAKALPEHCEEIIKTISKRYFDEDHGLYWIAVKSLVDIAKMFPEGAGKIVDDLLERCIKDDELHIREMPSLALFEMTEAVPALPKHILEILLERCAHKDEAFRQSATKYVSKIIQEALERNETKLEMLILEEGDETPSGKLVKTSSVDGIFSPLLFEEQIHLFLKEHFEGDRDGLWTVVQSFNELFQIAPNKVGEILDNLIAQFINHENSFIRIKAAEALSEIAGVLSDLPMSVISILLKRCAYQDFDFRLKAVEFIKDVTQEALKRYQEKVHSQILEKCDAKDSCVRWKAVVGLTEIVKTSPSQFDRIVNVLLEKCGDFDPDVRSEAVKVLFQISVTFRDRIQDMSGIFLRLLQIPQLDHDHAIELFLKNFSVKDLIDFFFECRHESILTILPEKLLQNGMALIHFTSNGRVKIVVQDGAEQFSLKRPRREMDSLLDSIKNYYCSKFPLSALVLCNH